MGENLHLSPRHRSSLKKPLLIVLLVCITSVLLVITYMYPQHNNSKSSACAGLSSRGCQAALSGWLPVHVRKFTDEEVAARVVIKDILRLPPALTAKSKIAFMFLTPGTLPFEKLWDKFFQVGTSSETFLDFIWLLCYGIWRFCSVLWRVKKEDSLFTSTLQGYDQFTLAVTFQTVKFIVIMSLGEGFLWLMLRDGF